MHYALADVIHGKSLQDHNIANIHIVFTTQL